MLPGHRPAQRPAPADRACDAGRVRGGRGRAADRLRPVPGADPVGSGPRHADTDGPAGTDAAAHPGRVAGADAGRQPDRRRPGGRRDGQGPLCAAPTGSSTSTPRRASRSARPSTPSAGPSNLHRSHGRAPRRRSPSSGTASSSLLSRAGSPTSSSPKRSHAPARASAAQKKPKKRKLWGKGTGKFRTTGSYSAATIRGTEWLVEDTCTTTLTRVKVGVVSIRDKVKKKTIIRRAGQRYIARKRK